MSTSLENIFVKRCFELAQLGAKHVSPNPMVGAVIVHNNKIISEGYHHKSGQAHAEVNAVNAVKDKSLLPESTIYVSLEPCAHYGKTPPCAELIVAHQFKKVVIATIDPHAKVHGKGIKIITDNHIEAVTLEPNELSQRFNPIFNTVHQKNRPYYILKWAQTANGFMDAKRATPNQKALHISNAAYSRWVHKIRTEVDGILIGKNTALLDNPELTSRKWSGPSPTPIIIDLNLQVPTTLKLFRAHQKVIIVNANKQGVEGNIHYLKVETNSFKNNLNQQLLGHSIQSVLVEGGAYTLNYFLDNQLWDAAYCISSQMQIPNGTKAPQISNSHLISRHTINTNTLSVYENN